jgi:hypothetical protein
MKSVCVVAALIVSAIFLTCRPTPPFPSQTGPFYLERAIYEQSSTQPVIIMREVVARRADGATAHIEIHESPSLPALRKLRMNDGSEVWLIDAFSVKTVWPSSRGTPRSSQPAPLRNCGLPAGNTRLLHHELVSGQDTVAAISPLEQGSQMEFWLAPALECEALRFNSWKGDKILSSGRLLRLTRCEPESALFAMGTGYTEIPASELKAIQISKAQKPLR